MQASGPKLTKIMHASGTIMHQVIEPIMQFNHPKLTNAIGPKLGIHCGILLKDCGILMHASGHI